MKNLTPTLLGLTILLSTSYSFSQAPAIQWQKSLGGSKADQANSIALISTGGYFITGNSNSNNGDVSGHHGPTTEADYWVVKLGANQNILWQKSYGGSFWEEAKSGHQINDGGYIVAGYSGSNDGDVTGHHGPTNGFNDFWILRLNKKGNLKWQKSLGGSESDIAFSIRQTLDLGFIVVGDAHSDDGDVTGHHGGGDWWVVKLDGAGNIQWQKALGGSSPDEAHDVVQTNEGGYIVVGYSQSNDGDVSGHHGSSVKRDVWVVKLDGSGNIEWSKSLGGSGDDEANAVQQTSDNGFIITGSSESDDGDVSGHHGSLSENDIWLVKLAANGDLEWQKSLGGNNDDQGKAIDLSSDGGYIVTGWSKSTNGNVSGNHGKYDYWVVKTDALGIIEWQNSFGGTKDDQGNAIKQTPDGGFIVAGESASLDGDVTGNHGAKDYWVIKLGPSSERMEAVIVNSESNIQDCSIFPDPMQNDATIQLLLEKNAHLQIDLFAQNGKFLQSVFSGNLDAGNHYYHLERGNLASGLYFIMIKSENQTVFKKLIVQ